jgi:hypothetical protein
MDRRVLILLFAAVLAIWLALAAAQRPEGFACRDPSQPWTAEAAGWRPQPAAPPYVDPPAPNGLAWSRETLPAPYVRPE